MISTLEVTFTVKFPEYSKSAERDEKKGEFKIKICPVEVLKHNFTF